MANAMTEVQAEIYKALVNRNELTSKVNGVYDYVPEHVKAPYITFGEITSTNERNKTSTFEVIQITIDVWTEAKGRKGTVSIINEIETALEDEIQITHAEASVIDQRIESRRVNELDYGLFHGELVFEVKVSWD